MNATAIAKSSPLYDYWRSEQSDEDEEKRLLKANSDSKAFYLFEQEPYKWENLFQSIIREIRSGDIDSLRGMHVLLSTLSAKEKEKTIGIFFSEGIFKKEIIEELRKGDLSIPSKKKNIFRFLRILMVIFTNPYGIVMRREKKHLYERTGTAISKTRNLLTKPFHPLV